MKHWIGLSVVVTGVLHTIVGGWIFADIVPKVVSAGVYDTVGFGKPEGVNSAFWFFYAGFLLLILGGAMMRLERQGAGLPLWMAWALLAFAVSGAVMMPRSGFWLLLVPVAGILFQTWRTRAADPSSN